MLLVEVRLPDGGVVIRAIWLRNLIVQRANGTTIG